MSKQNTQIFDLAIIGGGCSGLSLARELSLSEGMNKSVIVFEPRQQYNHDKTWCFWSSNLHPLLYKSWSSWHFSQLGKEITHVDDQQCYQCIRSIDFYADCVNKINACDSIHLMLNHRVLDTITLKDFFFIQTSAGNFFAKNILDTRLEQDLNHSATMVQSFVGVEVETSEPIFDPNQVDLMMDMNHDQNGFNFTYVLPFTTHHALIEPTRFHQPGLSYDVCNLDLDKALSSIVGTTPHSVIRREYGSIPMGLISHHKNTHNYIHVGIGSGAARASTGYAFLRIQNWAKRCAETYIKNNKVIPNIQDKHTYKWMDKLFLKIIKDRPDLTGHFFMSMAQQLAPKTFTNFLTEQATKMELLKVIRSLPAQPFLQQIRSEIYAVLNLSKAHQ